MKFVCGNCGAINEGKRFMTDKKRVKNNAQFVENEKEAMNKAKRLKEEWKEKVLSKWDSFWFRFKSMWVKPTKMEKFSWYLMDDDEDIYDKLSHFRHGQPQPTKYWKCDICKYKNYVGQAHIGYDQQEKEKQWEEIMEK